MAKQRTRNRKKPPSNSGKISEHFAVRDFVCKDPVCKGKFRISLGLVGGLELLRAKAWRRVQIVKGYVCPEASPKSFRKNYHVTGTAADITVNDLSPLDVFLLAETIPEFKGIGLNLDKKIVHVDTRKAAERVCWVVENDQYIDLTPDNRHRYLTPPPSPIPAPSA